ncbi:MAG: hypothetical protein JKY53_09190 [Flavobacteriales bacterium]|nr:hypothetical protein [Flavobacteriales bacterium]
MTFSKTKVLLSTQMGLFKNIKSAWRLSKYLKQLEAFDYQALYKKLGFENQENQYLLKTKQFNRGRQYVKSFGLIGLSFEKLIGRRLSSKELERIVLLSHLAPVYDDLFDKLNTPKERIILLLESTSTKPENDEESLFLQFYRPLFGEMSEKESFLSFFLKLTEAQENSKKQVLETTTGEEILKITEEKGGYSALVLFSLLDVKQKNETALYQLGACCQYMDDIFDWYDDSVENRKTIANTLSLPELKSFYDKQLRQTVGSFQSPFSDLVETLLTPGNICLDFYRRNGVHLTEQPTERIICDMESAESIKKLLFNLR